MWLLYYSLSGEVGDWTTQLLSSHCPHGYPGLPSSTHGYPGLPSSKSKQVSKFFEGVRPVIFTSNLISYPPFYFIVNKKTSLHCQKTNKLKSTFAYKKDICISVAY